MREFIGRFGETIHRPQPLYFYLPHLLHKFAPWSVLMIGLAIADLHSRKWQLRSVFRGHVAANFLAALLEHGRPDRDVTDCHQKRVDRIFPIIPPLCLLLAAQLENGFGNEQLRMRVSRWSAVALLLSILVTGGYTISKVVSGYRDHRDALAVFGRNVRDEAEVHHWRYEVISAKDEGLLLYLRRTHFIEPDRAIAEWNSGEC
jgi:hypothetical protein